jgi:hypothetical protein
VQPSRKERKCNRRKLQDRQAPQQTPAAAASELQHGEPKHASFPAVAAERASVQPAAVPVVDAPGPMAAAEADIECGSKLPSVDAAGADDGGGAAACTSALDASPTALKQQRSRSKAASSNVRTFDGSNGLQEADAESSDDDGETAGAIEKLPVRGRVIDMSHDMRCVQ